MASFFLATPSPQKAESQNTKTKLSRLAGEWTTKCGLTSIWQDTGYICNEDGATKHFGADTSTSEHLLAGIT